MRKEFVITVAAAAMAAAPVAFAEQAAPVAPAPAAADAVATLQKVCLPVLRGGAVKPAAQSAGFRLEDGGWVLPIAGKQEIDLSPPDHSNPHVCTLTIAADAAEGAAIRNALGNWAASQSPPLKAVAVDAPVPGAAQGWVTSTWSARTPAGVENVVLTQPQSPAAPSKTGQASPPASTLLVSLAPA